MLDNNKNPRLRKSILAAAISMALASGSSQAKMKLTEIQGLPDTTAVSQIRSGKDDQGNVIVSWTDNGGLYLQKLPRTGLVTSATQIDLATDFFDHDLAVKGDGSYLTAWSTASNAPPLPPIQVNGALSSDPSTLLELSAAVADSVRVFPKANGSFVLVSDQSASAFDADGLAIDTPLLPLEPFSAIAMDDAGDFILGTQESTYSSLSLQKGADTHTVAPMQTITPYAFGEKHGKAANTRVELYISTPKIVTNANGDILVAWQETVTKTQRKVKRTCYTDYGQKTCNNDGYTYSGNSSGALVAQRFNSDLTAKDPKPVAIATTKGKMLNPDELVGISAYIGDYSIAMDAEGDFALAYTTVQNTFETVTVDGYKYTGLSSTGSDLSVRQFITKKGKLAAGKAMKISSPPKSSHTNPKEKGKIKNSTQNEPSIVITDDASNAFVVTWHNDYQDHFKDLENTVEVCTRYKTITDEYGYSYKECVSTAYVPSDAYDSKSVLKAKRYSNQ